MKKVLLALVDKVIPAEGKKKLSSILLYIFVNGVNEFGREK